VDRTTPSYLVVGHLNKPHGTKGEIFVWPLTDHPGDTFVPGAILHLGDETGDSPDPARPGLVVQAARPFRKGFLLRVEGVEDRTAAAALQGRYLLRPAGDLAGLEEGEVFYHQLLGMRVLTVEGEEIGTIVEVYELRPADLLEVRGPRKTHFVPFLKSLVREVDPEAGTMIIDPPEGLLDL
jgi:16S rRNA processing protein RimM